MKVWTRLREKAGLPDLRIHDLRHQFASFLVNSGRSLYEVQQILGLRSIGDPTVCPPEHEGAAGGREQRVVEDEGAGEVEDRGVSDRGPLVRSCGRAGGLFYHLKVV